jgi:hypothetical protein
MRLFTRVLLLLVIALLLGTSLSSPQPAQAAQARHAWKTGFYGGWVFFSAKIDGTFSMTSSEGSYSGWLNAYNQAHGDLYMDIDKLGMGRYFADLPVEITVTNYATYNVPKLGNCTWTASAMGEARDLPKSLTPEEVDFVFELPIKLNPHITSARNSSSGSAKFCSNAGPGNETAMKTGLKETSSQIIKMLTFLIDYTNDLTAGGTCRIDGWEATIPLPNMGGQVVRHLETCQWKLFRYNPQNQPKGWN